MGYKERDAAERDLWQMAQEVGIQFERVGAVAGIQDPEVEIWIGGLVHPL